MWCSQCEIERNVAHEHHVGVAVDILENTRAERVGRGPGHSRRTTPHRPWRPARRVEQALAGRIVARPGDQRRTAASASSRLGLRTAAFFLWARSRCGRADLTTSSKGRLRSGGPHYRYRLRRGDCQLLPHQPRFGRHVWFTIVSPARTCRNENIGSPRHRPKHLTHRAIGAVAFFSQARSAGASSGDRACAPLRENRRARPFRRRRAFWRPPAGCRWAPA